MNESTQKVLLFLGGLALGTLGASMLNKHSSSLRPAMTGLTAGALELRDKAVGMLQRTKEDVSDFMAEVEYARTAKAAETEPAKPKKSGKRASSAS